MNAYLTIKTLHILSSVLLVGTGFGTAFYLFFANRTGSVPVIAAVSKLVVRADLWFTTPAVVVQPLSGLWLAHAAGWHWSTPWISLSIGLYLLAGACWLPVVWLQLEMARMAARAQADGAAALVLMRESTARKLGCKPIARIVGHASFAQEPEWFTTAPVGAIKKLYDKVGWKTADVDLFEINEAFAAVTMAAMKEHGIPRDKVNIHGGACAVGHPIGASGARIMVSLLGALKATQGKRGVATLCIGGGEATAIALELV